MFIVDDHAIVRAGLRQIAAADPAIRVAGEAASGEEAIAKLASDEVDVVVLDLSLPDRSGFNVLSTLVDAKPRLPVLILSVEREEDFAVRALRAGASGYLEKRAAAELLVVAIKQLAAGKKFVSSEVAERLALHPKVIGAERPHDILSQREFEIFLAVANGKPVSRIAADLHLSVKTVNNHRARILAKLGMKSTAELVRYAMRERLIH